MTQPSDSQSSFHSTTADEFEELIAQSTYYKLFKVRVGLQWMIRKEVREEFSNDSFLNDILRKEFTIGLQCNHPNIPKYYFLKEDQNRCLLYTEYIEGTSLENKVQSTHDRDIDNAEIDSLSEQILQTLIYLKHKDITYGDLHPGNIIYNHHLNKYYLIDFGIANTKDFSTVHGGRNNFYNKALIGDAQLLFSLVRIIGSLLHIKEEDKLISFNPFSRFIIENKYSLTLENALQWIKKNNAESRFKTEKRWLALAMCIMLIVGTYRYWLTKQYILDKLPNISISKTPKQENSSREGFKQPTEIQTKSFSKKEPILNLDTFRFIQPFIQSQEHLSKNELIQLRNKLILEYDNKFKQYLSKFSDSLRIEQLQIIYNKSYYADYLKAQAIIDNK